MYNMSREATLRRVNTTVDRFADSLQDFLTENAEKIFLDDEVKDIILQHINKTAEHLKTALSYDIIF